MHPSNRSNPDDKEHLQNNERVRKFFETNDERFKNVLSEHRQFQRIQKRRLQTQLSFTGPPSTLQLSYSAPSSPLSGIFQPGVHACKTYELAGDSQDDQPRQQVQVKARKLPTPKYYVPKRHPRALNLKRSQTHVPETEDGGGNLSEPSQLSPATSSNSIFSPPAPTYPLVTIPHSSIITKLQVSHLSPPTTPEIIQNGTTTNSPSLLLHAEWSPTLPRIHPDHIRKSADAHIRRSLVRSASVESVGHISISSSPPLNVSTSPFFNNRFGIKALERRIDNELQQQKTYKNKVLQRSTSLDADRSGQELKPPSLAHSHSFSDSASYAAKRPNNTAQSTEIDLKKKEGTFDNHIDLPAESTQAQLDDAALNQRNTCSRSRPPLSRQSTILQDDCQPIQTSELNGGDNPLSLFIRSDDLPDLQDQSGQKRLSPTFTSQDTDRAPSPFQDSPTVHISARKTQVTWCDVVGYQSISCEDLEGEGSTHTLVDSDEVADRSEEELGNQASQILMKILNI